MVTISKIINLSREKKKLFIDISQLILLAANCNENWYSIFNSVKRLDFFPFNIHLAIFKEPYLKYIFDGKKTIESRFSINNIIPYKKVEEGDVILLKRSGDKILGMCMVKRLRFYEFSKPDISNFSFIKNNFSKELCIDNPDFWIEKEKALYVSLIEINNVIRFQYDIICKKRDRRGWVIIYEKDIIVDNSIKMF